MKYVQKIPELVSRIDSLESELNGVRDFVQSELQSPREVSDYNPVENSSLVE